MCIATTDTEDSAYVNYKILIGGLQSVILYQSFREDDLDKSFFTLVTSYVVFI